MFARGVQPEGKMSSWCYDESEEDFTKGAHLCCPIFLPLFHTPRNMELPLDLAMCARFQPLNAKI